MTVDSGRGREGISPQAAQQRLRHGAGLAGEASDMTGQWQHEQGRREGVPVVSLGSQLWLSELKQSY